MNHEAFPFSRRNRSTLHYIRQLAREDSVHAIDHTKKNQELGAASGYEAGTRAGCRERAMIFVRRLKCLAAGWPRRLGAASTPKRAVWLDPAIRIKLSICNGRTPESTVLHCPRVRKT